MERGIEPDADPGLENGQPLVGIVPQILADLLLSRGRVHEFASKVSLPEDVAIGPVAERLDVGHRRLVNDKDLPRKLPAQGLGPPPSAIGRRAATEGEVDHAEPVAKQLLDRKSTRLN